MLKSMLILFFVNTHCKNKNIIRLNFELGDNYNLKIENKTEINEKFKYNRTANSDSALIPLKDLPKRKLLW
tara:strand:- start:15295 stop:15507 length:213 start_codon:yes stop_codon:yes gene_type:complete